MNSATSTPTISAIAATTKPIGRQPWFCATLAKNGRKTSCPVALAADKMPVTVPRPATNQRAAIVAATT